MAARHDITIDQGSTFTRDFIYKDEQGAPIDLTGYSARMQIRQTPQAAPIFDSADHAGSLVVTALDGKVTLTMTDEVTQAFPAPFDGKYDIEIESGAGVVTRLIQGSVRIDPNVTR